MNFLWWLLGQTTLTLLISRTTVNLQRIKPTAGALKICRTDLQTLLEKRARHVGGCVSFARPEWAQKVISQLELVCEMTGSTTGI